MVRDAPVMTVPTRIFGCASPATTHEDSSSAECEAIRPFVTECAGRLPIAGWSSTTRTLRVLSQLAAWAVSEGIALDPESILDPDTVERFVTQGLRERHLASHLSIGLEANRPFTDEEGTLGTPSGSTGSPASRTSPTRRRRWRPCRRLLGARAQLQKPVRPGLSWRSAQVPVWMVAGSLGSKPKTSALTGQSYWFSVGEPAARAVPVLAKWESEIVELASDRRGRVFGRRAFNVPQPSQCTGVRSRDPTGSPTALGRPASVDLAALASRGGHTVARTGGCGGPPRRHGAFGPSPRRSGYGRARYEEHAARRSGLMRPPLDTSGGRPTSGADLNLARQLIVRSRDPRGPQSLRRFGGGTTPLSEPARLPGRLSAQRSQPPPSGPSCRGGPSPERPHRRAAASSGDLPTGTRLSPIPGWSACS